MLYLCWYFVNSLLIIFCIYNAVKMSRTWKSPFAPKTAQDLVHALRNAVVWTKYIALVQIQVYPKDVSQQQKENISNQYFMIIILASRHTTSQSLISLNIIQANLNLDVQEIGSPYFCSQKMLKLWVKIMLKTKPSMDLYTGSRKMGK